MDEEGAGAGTVQEMTGSRRPLKKHAVVILLIMHSMILAAVPYVLRWRLEMSTEVVLLIQVAGYALLAAALWMVFRRTGRAKG